MLRRSVIVVCTILILPAVFSRGNRGYTQDVPSEAQQQMLKSADKDRNGKVSKKEFAAYVSLRMPSFDKTDKFFSVLDKDTSGTLDAGEFSRRLTVLHSGELDRPAKPAKGNTGKSDAKPQDRKKDETVQTRGKANSNARPATVLLITSAELSKAWREFADWKTRLGKPTKIVIVEQIAKQYKGKDVQAKIRACALEHINDRGTRWVVLGGDSQPDGKGHVPDRDTPHRVTGRPYKDIPTDLYYISEKNWDANGDGVYGDWRNDRSAIAYTNERAVIGRIPMRTADDVKAYTAKVIAYESRYPQEAFAQCMVYTCPIGMAYPKLNTSRTTIAGVWKGGELLQFFAGKTPWDKKKAGDFDLTPENWAKLINGKKAGKMHIHGHGFLPVWVLEGHKTVDARTVASLNNRDAYPVITTVSCFTGYYDAKQDPSITESMLRKKDGGAVAFVAPSREGVPIFSDPADMRKMVTEGKMDGTTQTVTRFWASGLGENLTIGEAFAAAKAAMTQDALKHPGYHWCQCELTLLGDPTLDLRAKTPTTPKLKLRESLGVGKQDVAIATGTPGATVCLWKGDEVYQVVKADNRGTATASVDLKTPGELLVAATGPNLNAALATVSVAKKNSPKPRTGKSK